MTLPGWRLGAGHSPVLRLATACSSGLHLRPPGSSAPAGAPTVPVFTRRALGDYTPVAGNLYHEAWGRRTNFANLSYAGGHFM